MHFVCMLQITYWDAYDGQAIRIIEGSAQAQVNTLCTDPAGEVLLSGGGDRLVKVWGYDEGVVSVGAAACARPSLLCGCCWHATACISLPHDACGIFTNVSETWGSCMHTTLCRCAEDCGAAGTKKAGWLCWFAAVTRLFLLLCCLQQLNFMLRCIMWEWGTVGR